MVDQNQIKVIIAYPIVWIYLYSLNLDPNLYTFLLISILTTEFFRKSRFLKYFELKPSLKLQFLFVSKIMYTTKQQET